MLFMVILEGGEESYFTGLEIKKMSGRKFATSYENLVTTLKILVAKFF